MKYNKLVVTGIMDLEILHFHMKTAFLYDLEKTLYEAINSNQMIIYIYYKAMN